MIDMQTLSKQKHIYRIYEDGADEIHYAKYPIIYLNSNVVYFKDGRKQEYLANVRTKEILDDFTAFMQKSLADGYYYHVDKYFWDVEGNLQELYQDFKNQRTLGRIISKEKQVAARLERAKKEFESASMEMAKVKAMKEINNV